jgi:hypothetical protein
MLRIVLAAAACLSLSGFLTTSDLAYGSQLGKADRLALQQREVRNYQKPRRSGNRLAFCTAAGQCGKHAADEFCRGNDFEGALSFERDRMEGHSAQLRFLRIKCWRSKGNIAAKQVRAPEVKKTGLTTNTLAKSNRWR